jgi:hypothetical protein
MMKISNHERCAFVLKLNPFELGIIIFLRTLHLRDELETVCEGFYETEDTSIFTWSSILGVGHYR